MCTQKLQALVPAAVLPTGRKFGRKSGHRKNKEPRKSVAVFSAYLTKHGRKGVHKIQLLSYYHASNKIFSKHQLNQPL
jgi:hypothetical protein